ncbi:hypothetical protein TWF694_011601 [Orbilia ellipsospora]|uniref:Ubiquitin-like domain-containing protein n=1 Tax=Orbilia ellipsospora TaxID=2528407 RepID=A0AAV9X5Q8_9PEZI
MASAFGFSVGDFISAAVLIKNVAEALKASGGATQEYQQVLVELEGLDRALKAVAALDPNTSNSNHVNAIRGMALSCQLPLRQFLEGLQKYDNFLGPFASGSSTSSVLRKAKWAMHKAESVRNLRAVLAAKVTSINLLLGLHVSESVSRIEPQIQQARSHLLSEILNNRQQQAQASATIEAKITSISNGFQGLNDKILASQTSIQNSLISLRDFGQQIISFLNSFPQEIRSLLQRILRTNVQIYFLLLHFQNNLTKGPSMLSDSNIFFEDALGRNRSLPYEWFRHWETFEGLLRAEFHDLPGESKVASGSYRLLDNRNKNQLITKENWKRVVFPGSTLLMAIVLENIRFRGRICPRPSCQNKLPSSERSYFACPKCGLDCHLSSYRPDLPDYSNGLNLEEDAYKVQKQQIDEDYRIFGTRFTPVEPMEINGTSFEIDIMSPHVSNEIQQEVLTSNTSTSVAMEDMTRKNLSGEYSSYQADAFGPPIFKEETATTTPLDTWLVSSSAPLESLQTPETIKAEAEIDELELFRHVHIDRSYEESIRSMEPENHRDWDDIQFNAQIFYRNLRDRFPQIPQYLQRRLAVANEERFKRLRRPKADDSRPRTSYQGLGRRSKSSDSEGKDGRCDPVPLESNTQATGVHKSYFDLVSRILLAPNRAETDSDLKAVFSSEADSDSEADSEVETDAHTDAEENDNEVSFWSQKRRKPGPFSSASGSSRRHDSLRGSDSYTFGSKGSINPRSESLSESSSQDFGDPLLSLPPPPIELGTQKSFQCDICGQEVEILGRREWK